VAQKFVNAMDLENRSTERLQEVFPGRRSYQAGSGQANHSTDVALTDTFPLANFDHRSRPTRHQIVKPPMGRRRRLHDRPPDGRVHGAAGIELCAVYWYFVCAIWPLLFVLVYLM
jgi:hypothetical protein